MLFFITGCGDKNLLQVEDFKNIIEKDDLTFVDVTSQYAGANYIQSASVASSNGDWQIEYYVLDSENNARNMFNTNQSIFESLNNGNYASTSVSLNNYSTYSLTIQDTYMYLCQVDNTLLYVNVDKDYTDEVKAIIKKLGY